MYNQNLSRIEKFPEKARFRQIAIYSFLVRHCFNLNRTTFYGLTKYWGLSEKEIVQLGITSCPTRVENLIASQACYKKFGDLSTTKLFYQIEGAWYLDIDEWLSASGVIVPIRSSFRANSTIVKLITDLRVCRRFDDEKPFSLRLRNFNYERRLVK